MILTTTHSALVDNFALKLENKLLRNTIFAIIGSALLWASAKVQVPFWPVPQTMQTFVVLALAMAYGWKLAGLTVLLYLAEGAAGLPVFAGSPEKGIGLAYMMGPTAGYLFGFFIASVICGFLANRGWDRSVLKTLVTMTVGMICIYACGLFWLGTLFGWDKPTMAWGATPFILGDVVKIFLAAIIMPLLWRYQK